MDQGCVIRGYLGTRNNRIDTARRVLPIVANSQALMLEMRQFVSEQRGNMAIEALG